MHTAWKVHLLNFLTFAILEADRAHARQLSGMRAAAEVMCYLAFGLFSVLLITFTTELHARAQFCSRNQMTQEQMGTFWRRSFEMAQQLGITRL